MKKIITLLTILLFVVFMVGCENSVNPTISDTPNLGLAKSDGETMSLAKGGKKDDCATIPGGTLYTSGGELITPGFMDNGYNYQAHLYNGDYYGDGWKLVMKWNDAWLSNKDCGGIWPVDPLDPDGPTEWQPIPDGILDRHLGYDTYIGSGAWETNHWMTTYTDGEGNECEYDYLIKIIAVPADAYRVGPAETGIWYTVDGVEIGTDIWGQFAIIMEVENDPCAGIEGKLYGSPDHAGFGGW